MVFEGRRTSELDVLHRALSVLQEFHKLPEERSNQNPVGSEEISKWKAPAAGTYKVNVDGGFMNNKAGIGIVIWDSIGDLIGVMASPEANITDPLHLEAVAIVKGVQFANDLALTVFCMESDSLTLVKRINSGQEDLSSVGHTVKVIQQAVENLCCLGVSHVRRTANVPAHLVAKYACNLVDFNVWIEEGPICIIPTVIVDQSE